MEPVVGGVVGFAAACRQRGGRGGGPHLPDALQRGDQQSLGSRCRCLPLGFKPDDGALCRAVPEPDGQRTWPVRGSVVFGGGGRGGGRGRGGGGGGGCCWCGRVVGCPPADGGQRVAGCNLVRLRLDANKVLERHPNYPCHPLRLAPDLLVHGGVQCAVGTSCAARLDVLFTCFCVRLVFHFGVLGEAHGLDPLGTRVPVWQHEAQFDGTRADVLSKLDLDLKSFRMEADEEKRGGREERREEKRGG